MPETVRIGVLQFRNRYPKLIGMNPETGNRVYTPAEDRLEPLRKHAVPAAVVLFVIAVLTSVFCLVHGFTIVFQNAFYLPILIIALYYPNRGMILAFFSSAVYFSLFLSLAPETARILPALIRILFYLVVSGGTVYVSRRRLHAEAALRHHMEHLEELVADQTRYISEKLERSHQLGEAYRKGNEYYEMLFAQVDIPVVVWNEDLYITDLNTAFCRFANSDSSELKGRKITGILPFDPDDFRNYPVQIEMPPRVPERQGRRSFWIVSRVLDPGNGKTRACIAVGMDLPAIDTLKQ